MWKIMKKILKILFGVFFIGMLIYKDHTGLINKSLIRSNIFESELNNLMPRELPATHDKFKNKHIDEIQQRMHEIQKNKIDLLKRIDELYGYSDQISVVHPIEITDEDVKKYVDQIMESEVIKKTIDKYSGTDTIKKITDNTNKHSEIEEIDTMIETETETEKSKTSDDQNICEDLRTVWFYIFRTFESEQHLNKVFCSL